MKSAYKKPLYICLILLFLLPLFGCGRAREVYRLGSEVAGLFYEKITPDQKPLLKKRVLIGPVIDMAGINDEIAENIRNGWIRSLRKDKYITLKGSKELWQSDIKAVPSQYGIIRDQEQLESAEEMGVDIFVSTVLDPMEIEIRRRGIWPFRDYARRAEIFITVNAFDLKSGALILSSTSSKKVTVNKPVERDAELKWDGDYRLMERSVASMIKGFSSELTDILVQIPWQGRTSLISDNIIRINGGRDIGVSEGSVFEVFEKGKAVRSMTGREYFITGQKIGEIRITRVSENYSEGAPLTGGNFEDGLTVRIKR